MTLSFLDTVKDAGIVGAGGAGFPTHVKLNAKAECFIVNAAECEPLIETDKYLCRTFADQIVEAVNATGAHLGVSRKVIALKGKYKEEIASLKAAINRANADIEILLNPASWHVEYSDKILAWKEIENLEEAIEHINEYSSGHTESIITEDKSRAQLFMNMGR